MIDLIVFWFMKSLAALICALPERVAYGIAKGVIRIFLATSSRYRKTALRNLEVIFPDKSHAEREAIYRESRDVLARNFFWFMRSPLLARDELSRWVDATEISEVVHTARRDGAGKGVLMLTLHAGCFELFAQAHALLIRPVAILARDFGLPRFDQWWRARRELFGNSVFSRRGGFKEMVARLQNGEDVYVLFDQNVKINHATFVPFFGIPASTSKAVALAAIRTGAPVMFAVGVEPQPHTCEIFVERLRNPAEYPGTVDEQIDQFFADAHRAAERVIRKHPAHWFWIHRRFKTRPAGEPETFYDS